MPSFDPAFSYNKDASEEKKGDEPKDAYKKKAEKQEKRAADFEEQLAQLEQELDAFEKEQDEIKA